MDLPTEFRRHCYEGQSHKTRSPDGGYPADGYIDFSFSSSFQFCGIRRCRPTRGNERQRNFHPSAGYPPDIRHPDTGFSTHVTACEYVWEGTSMERGQAIEMFYSLISRIQLLRPDLPITQSIFAHLNPLKAQVNPFVNRFPRPPS